MTDSQEAFWQCDLATLPPGHARLNEDLDQRVHAIVQTDGHVTDAELRAHLAERLAPDKLPKSFERAVGPLRDDAGKVFRGALRGTRIGPV